MTADNRSWLLVQEYDAELSRSKIKPWSSTNLPCTLHSSLYQPNSWPKFVHACQRKYLEPTFALKHVPSNSHISPMGHKNIINTSKRVKNKVTCLVSGFHNISSSLLCRDVNLALVDKIVSNSSLRCFHDVKCSRFNIIYTCNILLFSFLNKKFSINNI